MVFQDTQFLPVVETEILACRAELFGPAKIFLHCSDRAEQHLYLSPHQQNHGDGAVNSSNLVSSIKGFWVFATNTINKLKAHNLYFFECLNRYKGSCNSLTLLAEARAKRKQVFLVRYLYKDKFTDLYGG